MTYDSEELLLMDVPMMLMESQLKGTIAFIIVIVILQFLMDATNMLLQLEMVG